jgi:Helicase associated domain
VNLLIPYPNPNNSLIFFFLDESLVHGDCQVPTHYEKDVRLGFWVHQQRREYAKFMEGKPAMITSKRISDLEHIGFTWELKCMRIRKPYVPVKKRRNKEDKRTVSSSKMKKPRNKETTATEQRDDAAASSSDQDRECSESADDDEMVVSDEETQHLLV